MNILVNLKDDDFERYDLPWILWISFWAYRFPVNNLCFALDQGGKRDFKSVFIVKFKVLCDTFLVSLAVHLRVRVRDIWPWRVSEYLQAPQLGNLEGYDGKARRHI